MFHGATGGRDEFLSLQPRGSDGNQDLTVDLEILLKDTNFPELPLRPAWAGPELLKLGPLWGGSFHGHTPSKHLCPGFSAVSPEVELRLRPRCLIE